MGIQYGVLYRREILNEDINIYIFKPFGVITGYYNEETKKFIDNNKEERYLCSDANLVNTNEEYCIGELYTKTELLKQFPDAKNLEDAKDALKEATNKCLHFGVYDIVNDCVTISNIPFKSILRGQLENEYKSAKEFASVSTNDVSTFTIEEFTNLIKIDNYNTLINTINNRINDKNESFRLLNSKSPIISLMDSDLLSLIKKYSFEDINQVLMEICKNYNIEFENSANDIYEEVLAKFNSDISAFTLEEFINIIQTDDYEFLVNTINDRIDKNNETKELLNKNIPCIVMPNNILTKIVDNYSFDEIKEKLMQLFYEDKATYSDLFDDLNEEEYDYDDYFIFEEFKKIYVEFKKNVLEEDDIDILKNYIIDFKEVCQSMIDAEEEYDEIIKTTNDNPDYSIVVEFFTKEVKALNKLLKYEDIDELKEEFVKSLKSTQSLLHQMAFQLPNDDFEIEEKVKDAKEESKEKVKELDYKFDYKKVHDQMVSRIIGRDQQIDSMLTTILRNDRLKNKSKRNAMIIAGTTGTGKTQTYVELKRALENIRPVVVVDTNQLTQEGYVGGTIEENILSVLVDDAHNINIKKNGKKENSSYDDDDLELARHGIVILDEIDKRSSTDNNSSVNTNAVIHQLLKLMDPINSYTVKIGRQSANFDTSDLTIFASGAFQEYFDKKDKDKTNVLGFCENTTKKPVNNYEKYNEVDPNALVKYGLDRQFIGRFNKVILFPSHSLESLIELENNKATSNIQVEIDEYKDMGISFVWEDGFIEALSKKAYDMKTGGRALSNLLSRTLGNLNVEVNNRKGMFKAIYVPISAIEDSSKVMLLKQDNNVVSLKDLVIESQEENNKLKQKNDIERDAKIYKLMQKKCKDIK